MLDKFSSDGEVYLAMRKLSEDREEIWRWMYRKAKVWRAIYNHIADSEDVVIVSLPANHSIVSHRGTGPAIHLREFGVYAKNYDTKPATESSAFWLKIDIGFVHNDDDYQYGYADEIEKSYNFNVPTSLMFEFTDAAFNSWISDLRRERDVNRTKKDDEDLKKLINLYPGKAKLLLEQIHG
jgi:hypothetical protein